MSDYLPTSESEMFVWLTRYQAFIAANTAGLGLVAADVTAMGNSITAFQNAYNANTTAQNAAKQSTNAKDTAKGSCLTAVRAMVRKLQANPAITDAQREGLGINVKDKNPTPSRPVPDPAMTQPLLSVDRSQHEKHILSVRDTDESSKRTKPPKAVGFEVWSKVDGPAPTDSSQYSLAAVSPKLICTLKYDAAQVGKSVYYRVRWLYKDGQTGAWSDMLTAVVA